MLRRVYIDNFRCFVNFELSLRPQQLILGLNGTGKSALLEVLVGVKKLLTGYEYDPDKLFNETTRTRWQSAPKQRFELDVVLDAEYRLELELDSWGNPSKTRVKREVVLCDNRPIFEFIDGEVHLFNDRFERKVTYPFDWFRSALATIQPRPENNKLTRFKHWLENVHCLQLSPRTMSDRTEAEEPAPNFDLSNFASWYRHVSQERANLASELQESLRQIMPGFLSLDLRLAGANLRTLAVRFSTAPSRPKFEVAFAELSDGQRILICLYALLTFLLEPDACLFLDEPENYLAIPEIQPWLMELRDRIEDCGGQMILISHNPEMANYLAPEFGLVFDRADSGPVRVHPYKPDPTLQPSEQIARGW